MKSETELPKRKKIRLEKYDYSSVGAYFITICTSNRRNYFWITDRNGRPMVAPTRYLTPNAAQNISSVENNSADVQEKNPNFSHIIAINDCKMPVGATIGRPRDIELSPYGEIVEGAIQKIPSAYRALIVENYVIMPNHLHILLRIRTDENGRPMVAPTVSRIVNQLKGYVTKRTKTTIWQKSFYDHIIRDREDYEEHMKYIYENPMRWHDDELYTEE